MITPFIETDTARGTHSGSNSVLHPGTSDAARKGNRQGCLLIIRFKTGVIILGCKQMFLNDSLDDVISGQSLLPFLFAAILISSLKGQILNCVRKMFH